MSFLDLFEIEPAYNELEEWNEAKSNQELCEFEEKILANLMDEKQEMLRSSIVRLSKFEDQMRYYLERLEDKTDLIYQREVLPVNDRFEGRSGKAYGINCTEVIQDWYSE